ncbi:MAG: hypothetical protein WBW93_09435 [Steroidobacteraceae bacterium]
MNAYTALNLLELQQLAAARGVGFSVDVLGNESIITRARNVLTDRFLRSDATHLLFLDADIVLRDVADVFRMIDANKPIIGAACPRKTLNWAAVRNAVAVQPDISDAELEEVAGTLICRFDSSVSSFAANEPAKVTHLGTGCLLIKREVFDRLRESPLIETYWETTETERVTRFWRTGPNSLGAEISEDYFFLHAARLLGVEAYTLPGVVVRHIGPHAFKGNLLSEGALQQRIARYIAAQQAALAEERRAVNVLSGPVQDVAAAHKVTVR